MDGIKSMIMENDISFDGLKNFIEGEKILEAPRVYVEEAKIDLQFNGWCITFLRDGTFFPNDTSGI